MVIKTHRHIFVNGMFKFETMNNRENINDTHRKVLENIRQLYVKLNNRCQHHVFCSRSMRKCDAKMGLIRWIISKWYAKGFFTDELVIRCSRSCVCNHKIYNWQNRNRRKVIQRLVLLRWWRWLYMPYLRSYENEKNISNCFHLILFFKKCPCCNSK